MRNLKKTLCLILALVFVLGLCTVGAADIAFSDEKEIQYTEAVEFMAGLGILKGYEDGTFKPKGTLTRAEAAKIISYVVRGADVEYWPSNQVFDDVPANHWAVKYVSYCSQMGIINGVGNNKFDPNGKVTLTAVIKMLLSACGYGSKKGEEFTGADWSFNVLKCAGNTPILRGLNNVNLEGEATREETALLAYNTLMTVVRVTLSSDTNSYVNEYWNGSSNVTLAETTWGIRTDTGVVIANKSSSTTAKGTILSGTGRIMNYYITEEDENPNMLGHQIRITYRTESVNGTDAAVAYFIEDKCTEVKGADAARAYDADTVYCFNAGQLVNSPIPARDARATAPGTFVLNEDGRVVAYKTTGYFISYVTTNYWSQQSTVYDPTINQNVVIQLPAGAASGDLVTVYHVGDVYTAKLCSKQSYVQITSMDRDSVTKQITYNYGSIVPSQAANVWLPLNITRLDGTYQQLQLKYTYTLWFDDQGGCIGFSDASGSGSSVSADTYCLFDAVRMDTDSWGEPVYYAQVIMGDGAIKSLPISKTTYDAGLTNTVYKLTLYGSQYLLTPADASEMSYEAYTTDAFTDYSGATYVKYSGTKSSLTAAATAKRPKANSAVFILYTTERSVGVYVRRVKTVWFQTEASSDTPVNTSNYIYTTGALKSGGIVNGNEVYYYEGYLNGSPMADLVTSAAPAPGFYNGSKSTSTGLYTLSAVQAGDGTKTGVRTFTLVNNTDPAAIYDSGIGNGVLYLRDSGGTIRTMNLAGVAVIPVGEAAYYMGNPINSVTALQNMVTSNFKVTVTMVEAVSGSTHSVGGAAIYVTAISQ